MKNTIVILLSFCVCFQTFGQPRRPSRPSRPSTPVQRNNSRGGRNQNPTNQQSPNPTPSQNTGTSKSSGGNGPIYELAPPSSGGGGINDTAKVSRRNDNAIERTPVKDRAPLSYEHIREDDAVYKQRIWREIDSREKINLAFRYSLIEDNGSQRFVSILINAIRNGVTAFDADDDRFTTPLTTQQALAKFGSKIDTTAQYDLEGNITKYIIKARDVELDSVYKFRIKEEVVFDKESSRMFTRILGIAPMMPKLLSDGTSAGMLTLFWIYYPDLRTTLAKYDVYNPKNFGARMSWEDLFESRMFSSYITKSTFDNPFDITLKQKYGKNTLFALLEGESIKDKIFNYEQDLWSY